MKIRNPWVIRAIGFVGAWVIRVWRCTVRVGMHELAPRTNPHRPNFNNRFIYAFWHENILLACAVFGRKNIATLISQHADGEMIAQVCKHVGFTTIRGSSTRGGVQAMREMIRSIGSCQIAVVPDGPKGPRRHLEPGIIFLAAKTGIPIVAVGIGYQRPWRLSTWDKFVLPRPLTRARFVFAPPIEVPARLDREQMEAYRLRVQEEMDKLAKLAEELANG